MLLTIALCTWNRVGRLVGALDSFKGLRIPPQWEWEILVVDNNSTDETARVVERFSALLPIRYSFEARQGLSHARNRASREARGELVVFTDDDVIADPNWLIEYAAAVEGYPDAAFFGGTIDARFAVKPPRWLTANFDRFASAYALRNLGSGIHAVERLEDLPFGANMAFRREALKNEVFSPDLGRTGTNLLGGEETEFMVHLLARGEKGIWVGPARVEHVISKERLTLAYIREYFVWQGRGQVRQRTIDIDTVETLKKKSKRARRRLRLSVRKDAKWAKAIVRDAISHGKLMELAALNREKGG